MSRRGLALDTFLRRSEDGGLRRIRRRRGGGGGGRKKRGRGKRPDRCRKSPRDSPLPSTRSSLVARYLARVSRLNSRNCSTVPMFIEYEAGGRERRVETTLVNRPSRRLEGKLNYKDPDWWKSPRTSIANSKKTDLFPPPITRRSFAELHTGNFSMYSYLYLRPLESIGERHKPPFISINFVSYEREHESVNDKPNFQSRKIEERTRLNRVTNLSTIQIREISILSRLPFEQIRQFLITQLPEHASRHLSR